MVFVVVVVVAFGNVLGEVLGNFRVGREKMIREHQQVDRDAFRSA